MFSYSFKTFYARIKFKMNDIYVGGQIKNINQYANLPKFCSEQCISTVKKKEDISSTLTSTVLETF